MKKILSTNLCNVLLMCIISVMSLKVNANLLTNNLLVKELTVSPHTIALSSSASNTRTFTITSNVLWEVSSNQTWLTINKSSGSNNATITITVTANLTTSSRTAKITVSAAGVSDQTITVTQSASSTDVDETDYSYSVKTYPNPSNGRFTLSMNNFSTDKINVRLADLLGNIIKEIKLENLPSSYNHEIDITDLANGTYFIIIQTKNIKVVKTIILSKH